MYVQPIVQFHKGHLTSFFISVARLQNVIEMCFTNNVIARADKSFFFEFLLFFPVCLFFSIFLKIRNFLCNKLYTDTHVRTCAWKRVPIANNVVISFFAGLNDMNLNISFNSIQLIHFFFF